MPICALTKSLSSYYEDVLHERHTLLDDTRRMLATYSTTDDDIARRLGAHLTIAKLKRVIMVVGEE